MKSSLKIYFLIFIFLIFSTYSFKHDNKNSLSIFFPIKEIFIKNTIATNLSKLKSDLNILTNSSLFFLNKQKILSVTDRHDFITNIQLKKKYPNTLVVRITEKTPVAIQILGSKKFYITKNDEKIKFINIEIYKNLPLIFGNYKNFNTFYHDLKKSDFKIKEIKAFYYFDIGRWDIVLKNEKNIKLPEKNYKYLLPKINLMLDDNNFSKYKIFDFRIKDQLILQ